MQNTKRTLWEIAKEFEQLRKRKVTVPQKNKHGEDLHILIDAAISIITSKNNITDLCRPFSDAGDQDFVANIEDEAMYAQRWLDGLVMEGPSVGWEELTAELLEVI